MITSAEHNKAILRSLRLIFETVKTIRAFGFPMDGPTGLEGHCEQILQCVFEITVRSRAVTAELAAMHELIETVFDSKVE
jgi:hypothetical protein